SQDASSRTLLWAVVCLFAAAVAIALGGAGVHVQALEYTDLAIGLIVTAGLAILRRRITSAPLLRLCDFFETLTLIGVVALAGVFGSYASCMLTGALSDSGLARADALIGFEWKAAFGFVADHQWAQSLGRFAYRTIFLTPCFLLAALCASGRSATARRMVIVYAVALALTLALFAGMPAAGPLTHYGLAGSSYVPITNDAQLHLIEAARAGRIALVHREDLIGIVSFRSFHAASAFIFIWAAWSMPITRWITLAVNAAMLCATPVEGNHYFVDLIGGAAVAAVAVALVRF